MDERYGNCLDFAPEDESFTATLALPLVTLAVWIMACAIALAVRALLGIV